MQQPGEPSVEEILDSIKKVIARDNRDGLIAERRRKIVATPEPELDDVEAEESLEEVLELDADFAVEAIDDEAEDVAETLIRDETRDAMRQNFAALAMLSQPGKAPQIVRSGETSLEGLVREMLRPMLAKWLDEHLPAMVEEMVKAEIARIAGKKA